MRGIVYDIVNQKNGRSHTDADGLSGESNKVAAIFMDYVDYSV